MGNDDINTTITNLINMYNTLDHKWTYKFISFIYVFE